MKKQACKKVALALLPHLSGYVYESEPNAVFQAPVGQVFRGMIFDSSGFSSEVFYPHVFVLPLYVPTEHVTLSFGKRLPGSWTYEPGKEESLASKLLKSLEREHAFELWEDLSTADRFARNLSQYYSNPNDPYFQQAIAYSFAICGHFDRGLHLLNECRSTLCEMQERQPGVEWHAKVLDEVTKFSELIAKDPDAATRQLDEWTEYTRSKLRLPA